MTEVPALPIGLRVVAALFLLSGFVAAIQIVMAIIENRVNLDFSVVGLFIGPGLLALKPGWRTCALVLLWISLIGLPVIGLLVLAQGEESGRYFFTWFGSERGEASKGAFLLFGAFIFVLNAWQIRVLMRDDVLQLFGLDPNDQAPQVD